MREIKQGTLFGFNIVLKVPDDYPIDDLIINEHTLEKYVKDEIEYAKRKRWE